MHRSACIIIGLAACISCSPSHYMCRRWRTGGKIYRPTPPEYYRMLDSFHYVLKQKATSYAFYSDTTGNCFGGSLKHFAVAVWTEQKQGYYRFFSKPNPYSVAVLDSTFAAASAEELFGFFEATRLDTVTTLPQGGWIVAPGSPASLEVWNNGIHHQWNFDSFPFWNSRDTLHPLRQFTEQLLQRPDRTR